MNQRQQQGRVYTCTKLLENPNDSCRFWRPIVTGMTHGGYFIVTPTRRTCGSGSPPNLQVVAKEDRFAQKVMLCVIGWNLEGIINHFEPVQNDAVNAEALYSEQWGRVYAALAARRYPAALIY